MKKIYSILAILFACTAMVAQPTITNSIMFDVGDSGPVQNFVGTFDGGPTGANVTWDYSSVTPSGQEFSWTAVDPASTPWGSEFPTATMAFDYPLDTIRDVRYYNFDGTSLKLLGVIQELSGSSMDTLRYDFNANPTLELQLPFTYNDQVADNSSGTATISVAGMSFVVDRTIERDIKADAYGTLTTPLGTFQNVLRVSIKEDITDKIFGQTNATQDNKRYFWYLPDEKYLLLQMDSIVVKPVLGPSFPSTSMFYRSGAVTTGLDKNIAQEIGMNVYPNPANEAASLSFELDQSGSVQVELLNNTGQLVKMVTSGIQQSGLHQYKLHTADLAQGIYWTRVITSSGTGVQMLIISH